MTNELKLYVEYSLSPSIGMPMAKEIAAEAYNVDSPYKIALQINRT